MRVPASASAGVALLVAAGCSAADEPSPRVNAIDPAEAYNDADVAVSITGGWFRPVFEIDTGDGRASVPAGAYTMTLTEAPPAIRPPVLTVALAWTEATSLRGTLPGGLPAGEYTLAVHGPDGAAIPGASTFRSLGPDVDAPSLTIVTPVWDTLLAADSPVAVEIVADDGAGHLASLDWTLYRHDGAVIADGRCSLAPGADPAGPRATSCTPALVAPAPGAAIVVEGFTLSAHAVDTGDNESRSDIPLWVARAPQITGWFPATGPASGMTLLTVTGGTFTSQGSGMRILVDGVPALAAGPAQSSTELTGLTPPHDPGSALVTVDVGGAEVPVGSFEYVGVPGVRAVDPASGPVAGGGRIAVAGNNFREGTTRIIFAGRDRSAELRCPRWVSANRIEGFVPTATAAGPVQVQATDMVGGQGDLVASYLYEDPPPPPAGASADGDADAGAGGDADAAAPPAPATPTPTCATADGGLP